MSAPKELCGYLCIAMEWFFYICSGLVCTSFYFFLYDVVIHSFRLYGKEKLCQSDDTSFHNTQYEGSSKWNMLLFIKRRETYSRIVAPIYIYIYIYNLFLGIFHLQSCSDITLANYYFILAFWNTFILLWNFDLETLLQREMGPKSMLAALLFGIQLVRTSLKPITSQLIHLLINASVLFLVHLVFMSFGMHWKNCLLFAFLQLAAGKLFQEL